MKPMLLSVAVAFFICSAYSMSPEEMKARDEAWFKSNPSSMPKWETWEELTRRDSYFAERRQTTATALQGPLRFPGEYERVNSVVVRYPFGISTSIIREMARGVRVYVLATSSQQSAARTAMQNGNVDMTKVQFVDVATDSYWTRDYTPWPVFDVNGKLNLVDFTYNRPRPRDDAAGTAIARAFNLPRQTMNVIHAGGNMMVDGFGNASSTDLVYEENQASNRIDSTEVNRRIKTSLGVNGYHVVADPTGEYIKHIDTWAKYLGPDKILIRRVPSSHRQYTKIENSVRYYSNIRTPYGNRFRIFRVDTPNDEPYANSIILNNKILVSIMGTSRDNPALDVFRQAMPGYTIIGYTGTWESTDALHCRSYGITDPGLLYISHRALRDTVAPVTGGFRISAEITALSGQRLISDSVALFYKYQNQSNFTKVLLKSEGGDRFSIFIPTPVSETEISYFIQAADNSGRIEYHPFIGQPDPHRFVARVIPVSIKSRKDQKDSRSAVPYGLKDVGTWRHGDGLFDALGRYLPLSTK